MNATIPASLLLAAASLLVGCGARTGLGAGGAEGGTDASEAEAGPPGCGPSSCAGCCDDAGVCQPGTTIQSCGIEGEACQACDPAFDVCDPRGDPNVIGAVCYEPCPLRSCTGCCTADGACVDGEADTACGGPSRVCADCTASGQTCGMSDHMRTCM